MDWTAYGLNVAKEKIHCNKEKLEMCLGLKWGITEPSLKRSFMPSTLNHTSKMIEARFFKTFGDMELKTI